MLKDLIKKKVDYIISIGEARPQIKSSLKGVKPIFETKDFSEAVLEGFKKAKKGGSVLLSPGCSSFDMFKNYEHRGEEFKREVYSLTNLPDPAHAGLRG